MLRVIPVPGEPASYDVESHELQCTNPECAKLFPRLDMEHVHFTRRQEQFLRLAKLWGKVKRILDGLAQRYRPLNRVGSPCPRCGQALDLRFHRVQLELNDCVGWCSCEVFYYVYQPALAKMASAEERIAAAKDHRCQHLFEARDFALDLTLRAHVETMKGTIKK